MCSLEVPDIQESVVQPFHGQDLVAVLVNVEESLEQSVDFIGESGTTLPVLLDSDGAVYNGYGWNDGAFAPFPFQVVVDRQGVIRYIGRQYDAVAVRAAIEEALAASP